ncbi:MAG: P-II family nitrogen regulator [Lachnospiraceae bacterium]|nr:P-II family nitrogen regulator [Lachnospiraceae bacterium]
MKNSDYQMIICIVNEGYSQVVMEAAKEAGAGGGTVIHGRGTANKEAEKMFGIVIQPDKEIVLIIVKNAIRDKILEAVNKETGLETAGGGIAFSLPVDRTIGLS